MRERTRRRQQERAEKKARSKVIKAQFNSDKDKSFAFLYSPESHDGYDKNPWGEDILLRDIHGEMKPNNEIPEDEIDSDSVNRRCLTFHKGMPSFIIPINEYTVDRIVKETESVRGTREDLLLWAEFWWDIDYFDQVWDSRRDEFIMRIDLDKLPPNNVEPYEDYKFKEEDGTPSNKLLYDLREKIEYELEEWVYMENFGKEYGKEIVYEDLIELDTKYLTKLLNAGKITEEVKIEIESLDSEMTSYWNKKYQEIILSRPPTEEEKKELQEREEQEERDFQEHLKNNPDSPEAQREKAKAYDHITYVPVNSEDKEDCRTMNWLSEGYEDWVRTEVDGKPICVSSISDEDVYYAEENVYGRCFNHEGNEDCKWFGSFEDGYPPSCTLPLKLVEGSSLEATAMKEKIKKLDPEGQWFGGKV